MNSGPTAFSINDSGQIVRSYWGNDTEHGFLATPTGTQLVAENTSFVAALTSTAADTVGINPAIFSITGGTNAALFDIVGGHLVFKTAKDFEADPHSYQVEVSANDGVNTTAELIAVNLTDVNEAPPRCGHADWRVGF